MALGLLHAHFSFMELGMAAESSEQALRESEKKYSALFEHMINGFAYHKVVFDDHGKPVDYIFLDINPAFERLTGLKKENVIGKRATDLLPGIEDEPAKWIETYGRVALTGKPIRFESYSDILKRWYSVSAYSPEKGYFASIFEDTTERRQKDERLRQSEAKFRLLSDNTYDMVFWIDPEGHYIFVSPSCKRITGYDPHEFIENPGLRRSIVHPEDLPIFDRHLQEERLAPQEIDYRIIRADGSICWVSQGCLPIVDEEGRFIGLRGSNRDITERKHAEMLSQAANSINLIINSSLDPDEIMNRAVSEACKALGAESSTISLRKEDGWSVAYAHGFSQPIIGVELSDEQNPHALLAIKNKEVVAVNDAFNDERVDREVMKKYNVRSVMVIPLVVKGKAIGALFVNHHVTPAVFTELQIDFAKKLGSSLSLSLENAGLLMAERKGKERFELLSDTASRLLAADQPQEIVNELCRNVIAHLNCHAFFNYLVEKGKQRLHLNAYAGIPAETAKEIEWLDYGVAVCGCAARDACRIVAEDIPNTPDIRTDLVKSLGIKAYACHPLISAGRVIGTLSFGTRTRTTFTDEDLSLMKTVADQVAVAMEGKRLLEAVSLSRDELAAKVKERTAELSRTNELLEKVFASIDTHLAYMDRHLNFIRVNRAYAEADERQPAFYVGKNHFALFPNEENQRIFEKVVTTGEPYYVYAKPFEYAEHPERGVTYWDWSLQPVNEPDGSVGGIVLSLVNVTERVRAQETVRAERQLFNNVLESLPAYVVLLTPDYHVRFSNRCFRERFGECQGLRCFEFLFGRSEPCEICETCAVLKSMAPHEWEWTGPDGRLYSVFDFPFTDTDGSTLILEMGIDITDRKKAEESLLSALSEIKMLKDRLEAENIYLRQEMNLNLGFNKIIGTSNAMTYVLYRVEQVAPAKTTVLVLGETGTGKELIASAIHEMSPRKRKPMITLNCAALPANLMESELFGRERGAFTGADTRQIGRFEIADGSTLCLDEIGELPLELQAKLLRVIQHGEFERLGSSQSIKVDVRIVATTNRNLEEEVRKGRFRQDLFYRLNVFPITVPPLRHRKDDIPLLVHAFVDRFGKAHGKKFTSIQSEAMKALQEYDWPGNVRELENVIERAVIMCPGTVLRLLEKLEHISPSPSSLKTLEAIEREQILKTLLQTRWRINGKNGAAAILGLNPSTLRARMHKLGIYRPEVKA
jgi:formate hydrogenlyase transcriptional activator